ncbi:MAG TPA: endonuclease domain-containing protein [Longimicrobium sp.]|nr:endonuclease domain-containing protein [Longimicrobium sp.]
MRKTIRGTTPELEQAAQAMRREPTAAEAALWGALQKKQVAGLKFRRQHPVGRFVLDFYCASLRLVVEVDGGIHDAQQDRDAARTEALETHGYRVLRFRNEEVLRNLDDVVRRIAAAAAGSEPA